MKINILLCDPFQELLPPDIPSYSSMFQRLFNAVGATLAVAPTTTVAPTPVALIDVYPTLGV